MIGGRGSPILVTGAHRSGSTLVGRVLSVSPRVGYVHEPFSKLYGLEGIDRWFLYIRPGLPDEPTHRRMIERLLAGEASYKRDTHSPAASSAMRRLGRFVSGGRARFDYFITRHNPFIERFLIKDPLACMSSEYLHRTFAMDVVVVIRHPAAFAASLEKAQEIRWREFDFEELFSQPELMSDHLDRILQPVWSTRLSGVERAAVLWRCIYAVLSEYLSRNPQMMAIRHEDLSSDPIGRFEELYRKLNLPFTNRARRKIESLTSPRNAMRGAKDELHDLRRDSRSNRKRWTEVLSKEEVHRIRDRTEEIASLYYSDADW